MAKKQRRKRVPAVKSAVHAQKSSRKDIIIDSGLIMLVAVLVGLAWQLYPDLSALVRRLIFVAALAIGTGTVVLRAKDIIR